MPRVTGVRVLVVHDQQILLVEHEYPEHGRLWLLPGGGREDGETLAGAAQREVREETGVVLSALHRVALRRSYLIRPGSMYALFVGETEHRGKTNPEVELATERYLRRAAWHPLSEERPIGPLDPRYWSYLEPFVRECLRS